MGSIPTGGTKTKFLDTRSRKIYLPTLGIERRSDISLVNEIASRGRGNTERRRGIIRDLFLPGVPKLKSGWRMTVVRLLWEQLDWVQLPAARLSETKERWRTQIALRSLGGENRSDVAISRLRPRGVGCELRVATATLKLVADSQQPDNLKKALKKTLGVILIILGFLALVTPFTPGSWLIFIGLELAGIHVLFLDKIKKWLN